MQILLIDDDASLRRTIRMALETAHHDVVDVRTSEETLEQLEARPFDAALLDLRLGTENGLDLLTEMLRVRPGLCVVIMTAYAAVDTAVEAMRRGAFDYLPKPFTPAQLRLLLERAGRVQRLENRVRDLEAHIREVTPEADLETFEPRMQQVLDIAFKAAASEATLLLRGESGTGKGVLARALHARSQRSAGPFVTVHCPSLSAELLESELFGHVRGAFTGAIKDTRGKVNAAEGGTLFLDEIGDLPPALQPKLLRLLQEKSFERVGDTKTQVFRGRIMAATNRPLEAEVAAGRFRGDLFYRFNAFEITLPPLRERRADILPIASHLLAYFARQSNRLITSFSPEARAAIASYAWPGNLRELRNALERAVILAAGDTIGLADLPATLTAPPPAGSHVGETATLDRLEAEHIRQVLGRTPTMEEAAAILGIDPSTLYRKRKRYGL
ncbi:sigma-54-dependent response regulator transcription factor AlgB [soil metagenome]